MENSLEALLDLCDYYLSLGLAPQILLHALAGESVGLEDYHPETLQLAYDFLDCVKPFMVDVSEIDRVQGRLAFRMYYEPQ